MKVLERNQQSSKSLKEDPVIIHTAVFFVFPSNYNW
jgi:hypothetical protein